jgi:hypothetical protein
MSCSQNLAGTERAAETFGLLSVEMSAQEIGPVTPSEFSKYVVHPLAQRASDHITLSVDSLLLRRAEWNLLSRFVSTVSFTGPVICTTPLISNISAKISY